MVKSQLIKTVASSCKLQVKDAEIAVNTVLDSITRSLVRGNRVELRGFGSFGLKDRRAREGRNPKNGEAVLVPGKRVLFFKTGKTLRERVDR